MQVFKLFYKIVKKNMVSLCIYVFIFFSLAAILAMTYKNSSNTGVFEDQHLDIAVIDRDHTELSGKLLDYAAKNHKIIPLEDNKDAIRDGLFYRYVYYVLIIPEGFEQAMAEGRTPQLENIKVPDSQAGYFMDQQLSRFMTVMKVYTEAGYTIGEAGQKASDRLEAGIELDYRQGKIEREKSSFFNYYQFIPYVLSAMICAGMGPAMMVQNQKNIKQRNRCSCMRPFAQNMWTAAASLLFMLIIVGLFIAASLFYGELFSEGGLLAAINTLCFGFVSVSIAFVAGILVKTYNGISAVLNTVSLGMSFLGGVFVPLELMADGVKKIAHFVPSYWYIRVNDMASAVKNAGIDWKTAGQYLAIQLGFAAAIFAVGLVLGQRKQD